MSATLEQRLPVANWGVAARVEMKDIALLQVQGAEISIDFLLTFWSYKKWEINTKQKFIDNKWTPKVNTYKILAMKETSIN